MLFRSHVKGHELAAWNVPVNNEWWSVCYATSNRGACHLNGGTPQSQDEQALEDSLGACSFASRWYRDNLSYAKFLSAITGIEWSEQEFRKAGTRIFTLEKMFNYREGFRREDDTIPEKFFQHEFSYGDHKGAIVERDDFREFMDKYYKERNWDLVSSKPDEEALNELGLEFTISNEMTTG